VTAPVYCATYFGTQYRARIQRQRHTERETADNGCDRDYKRMFAKTYFQA